MCIIRLLFKGACWVAAVMMVLYWMFEFSIKDEDLSIVDYKTFYQETNIMLPEVSLCIENPFIEDKLKEINSTITISKYLQFLKGEIFDEQMKDIDYDNVTLDIVRYLDQAKIVLANGSLYHPRETFRPYVGIRSSSLKCFSFDTPFIPRIGVEYLVVVLKNSIFPHGTRPTHHNFNISTGRGGGFEVRFNYPRQVFRSYFTAKWIWESLGYNSSNKWIGMTFKMKNIEALKRRSKYALPCNNDWKHDDEKIMDEIIKRIQCKPPHLDRNYQLEICSAVRLCPFFM